MAREPEGKEPPTEAQVRSALVRFGELIRRLDEDDRLLRSLPFLMGRMGDIRRLLFAYEVRVTERLLPSENAEERESRRIVQDAIQRELEMTDEWKEPGPWASPETDDEGSGPEGGGEDGGEEGGDDEPEGGSDDGPAGGDPSAA